MIQSDGSELLGVNNLRSKNISVIKVAPTDDRVSVLSAIFAQDKFGREQVVVVLPEENKAFQRSVDFDGLKDMRRGLKTQIVFIAPDRSGPSEFARQRRFAVFPSLQDYAQFLQSKGQSPNGNGQDAKEMKKGWLFGRRQKPTAAASPSTPIANGNQHATNRSFSAMPLPVQEPQVMPTTPDTEDDYQQNPIGTGVNPMGAVAAGLAADRFTNVPEEEHAALSTDDEDWDELPPILPVPSTDDSSLEKSTPAQGDKEASSAISSNTLDTSGPAIIAFPPPRPRSTGKLPVGPAVAELNPPAINPSTRQHGGLRRAGAAGLAGGTVLAATTSGGSPPPPVQSNTGGGGGGSAAGRNRGRLLALLALLLLTLLLVGGIVAAAPGGLIHSVVPGSSPTATVTITPANVDLKNTYVITGVTGTPVASQRQVQAKILMKSATQSNTVSATGTAQTPGAEATGSLTFYNGLGVEQTVGADTVFTVNGVNIVNNIAANIPAGGPGFQGSVTVPAHATTVGVSGDIPAGALNGSCCSATNSIFVKNLNAFTGGQNPKTYTIVQQSDINNALNPLKASLLPSTQKAFQALISPGQRLVSPDTCTTNVTQNHAAGDAASSVTVTVSVTCTGEVYDEHAAQAMAGNLLTSEASTNYPGYKLVGNLLTSVVSASVRDSRGTLAILASAAGVWVYPFTKAQEQNLASLIKGMSKQNAMATLAKQPGVGKVDSINITGGDGVTLPTDPKAISIVPVNVLGAQGTPTPATGPGTPIVGSPTQGTPTPQNGLGGS